ncbi:leucine-rich repeat-containing G-protein coupled receptor 6-like, partial [Stylophora pistillata]|uniref:leucine-rich repeat-containing G-protein coupled receptor 6-like n=1 Tax=Stylophora pistillata TaxID=50429 RepID=UPI000C0427E9
MSKASSIRSLTCNPLAPLVLVLWLMASGFCCPLYLNPGSCLCKPFGHHRISITCKGITNIPRDLPPNTAILDVSINKVELIPEKAFQNLTSLTRLNLSWNMLKLIPDKAFQNLTSLTYLDLSWNMLKLIPDKAFQNLMSLTNLVLKMNMLKLIPEKALQNLTSLTH